MKYPKFRGEPLKLERNEDNDDLLFGKRVANFLGKLPGTRKRRACIDIEQVMLQYEEEIECDG
jgi:hypothetical protein